MILLLGKVVEDYGTTAVRFGISELLKAESLWLSAFTETYLIAIVINYLISESDP